MSFVSVSPVKGLRGASPQTAPLMLHLLCFFFSSLFIQFCTLLCARCICPFAQAATKGAPMFNLSGLIVPSIAGSRADKIGMISSNASAKGITRDDVLSKNPSPKTSTIAGSVSAKGLDKTAIADKIRDIGASSPFPSGDTPTTAPTTAPTTNIDSAGTSSGKSLDYLNADLAQYYGMDKSTAYQEALSNTAYQRSVADMQAAGLNPSAIYAAGRGTVASGVGYVGDMSSGGTSGYSGYSRSSGASGSLSKRQYYGVSIAGAVLGYVISGGKMSGAVSGASLGQLAARYLGST